MNTFDFLTPDRLKKPRNHGITMMLDKGMGLMAAEDLLEISGEYVDFAKFGWGTILLHDKYLIKDKIDIYLSYNVNPYPGGTLFEIAYLNNKFYEFLDEADRLGFNTIEISDGSTNIQMEERGKIISQIKDHGFYVITEVGKKDPKEDVRFTPAERAELVNFDLDAGADKVLIEARESGKNVGIFDEKGNVKEDEVEIIIKNTDVKNLIWETPQKNQQVYFILKFGPNVNLGNIPPEEITALETMRRGLRGDTLGKVNLE
ncbi:MAG: phosphosulfolactate synthase [Euryarchaeota archaeon]|nr:phosphosulfolactate synthase [Euryarchaeota archaeon]